MHRCARSSELSRGSPRSSATNSAHCSSLIHHVHRMVIVIVGASCSSAHWRVSAGGAGGMLTIFDATVCSGGAAADASLALVRPSREDRENAAEATVAAAAVAVAVAVEVAAVAAASAPLATPPAPEAVTDASSCGSPR